MLEFFFDSCYLYYQNEDKIITIFYFIFRVFFGKKSIRSIYLRLSVLRC